MSQLVADTSALAAVRAYLGSSVSAKAAHASENDDGPVARPSRLGLGATWVGKGKPGGGAMGAAATASRRLSNSLRTETAARDRHLQHDRAAHIPDHTGRHRDAKDDDDLSEDEGADSRACAAISRKQQSARRRRQRVAAADRSKTAAAVRAATAAAEADAEDAAAGFGGAMGWEDDQADYGDEAAVWLGGIGAWDGEGTKEAGDDNNMADDGRDGTGVTVDDSTAPPPKAAPPSAVADSPTALRAGDGSKHTQAHSQALKFKEAVGGSGVGERGRGALCPPGEACPIGVAKKWKKRKIRSRQKNLRRDKRPKDKLPEHLTEETLKRGRIYRE